MLQSVCATLVEAHIIHCTSVSHLNNADQICPFPTEQSRLAEWALTCIYHFTLLTGFPIIPPLSLLISFHWNLYSWGLIFLVFFPSLTFIQNLVLYIIYWSPDSLFISAFLLLQCLVKKAYDTAINCKKYSFQVMQNSLYHHFLTITCICTSILVILYSVWILKDNDNVVIHLIQIFKCLTSYIKITLRA